MNGLKSSQFRAGNLRRSRNGDQEILPLINVVFLLLIFFMVAGRLEAGDPFAVDPPLSTEEDPAGEQTLVILLGADGRKAVNGALVSDANLETTIRRYLDIDMPVKVRIKADGRADAAQLLTVLELFRDAGVETVRLLTITGTD